MGWRGGHESILVNEPLRASVRFLGVSEKAAFLPNKEEMEDAELPLCTASCFLLGVQGRGAHMCEGVVPEALQTSCTPERRSRDSPRSELLPSWRCEWTAATPSRRRLVM